MKLYQLQRPPQSVDRDADKVGDLMNAYHESWNGELAETVQQYVPSRHGV